MKEKRLITLHGTTMFIKFCQSFRKPSVLFLVTDIWSLVPMMKLQNRLYYEASDPIGLNPLDNL